MIKAKGRNLVVKFHLVDEKKTKSGIITKNEKLKETTKYYQEGTVVSIGKQAEIDVKEGDIVVFPFNGQNLIERTIKRKKIDGNTYEFVVLLAEFDIAFTVDSVDELKDLTIEIDG